MKFNKITILDNCGLTAPVIEKIQTYSTEHISIYYDFPESYDEIMHRIGNTDCLLVSWHTRITAEMIQQSPSLKYIGMCCSLYDEKAANVDIAAARKAGIVVKGVKDYGDEGTVEFIFAQLICLVKGLGKYQWRNENTELTHKSFGIIGLGTLGQMVARTAHHFGMKVYYFSRTRKPELENEDLQYLPLEELLQNCDVISTHVPRNSLLLSEKEFAVKKKNSILINTSLGLTFEKEALINWLNTDKTSFAILDGNGARDHFTELNVLENVIAFEQYSGMTTEAKQRLSEKALHNLVGFLADQ